MRSIWNQDRFTPLHPQQWFLVVRDLRRVIKHLEFQILLFSLVLWDLHTKDCSWRVERYQNVIGIQLLLCERCCIVHVLQISESFASNCDTVSRWHMMKVQSIVMQKRAGARMQPCLTPNVENRLESRPPSWTQTHVCWYRSSIRSQKKELQLAFCQTQYWTKNF